MTPAKKKSVRVRLGMKLSATERIALVALLQAEQQVQALPAHFVQTANRQLRADMKAFRAELERRVGIPSGALQRTHQVNLDTWRVEAKKVAS